MASTEFSAFLKFELAGALRIDRPFSGTDTESTKYAHDPTFVVPAMATDMLIPLYDITTVKTIMISVENEELNPANVTMKLDNVGNTPIPIKNFIYLRTTATAVYLSNSPSTNDAHLKVSLIGE